MLPTALKAYDVQHPSIPSENLIWTETMHVRLATFHKKCDAIVVLPGGFGTLHELMDLLNLDDFWSSLLKQFTHMVEQKALNQQHLSMLKSVTTFQACMGALKASESALNKGGLDDRSGRKRAHKCSQMRVKDSRRVLMPIKLPRMAPL